MASEEWCSADPAVPVRTPGGATVVVYLNEYALGTEHRAALARATHSCSVTAAPGGRGTDVEITVLIPGDRTDSSFRTRATVTTAPGGRGAVLDSREGVSGVPLVLRFRLDVA
ncbi:MAG: hypothetical protein AVDCRST_MAG77-5717 [uncultured Chloroflexi bacterium]|uniref:Uncharacterized protein n=1 Tax=uncultured Chloroflexota bacterium TaxID=166587 RepID=A0A6J4KBW8_9CHLR|nr:MAG: hypothetical protein AVDCRST_MAG77-5717 [uncultured Chloroflexota bacterium]